MVSTTKGIDLMSNILKDFLLKPKHSNGFMLFIMIFSMSCVLYFVHEKTHSLICFEKVKLIELEKSIKTNKILRGTYNDV